MTQTIQSKLYGNNAEQIKKNNAVILDATASQRMMWFDKDNPNALFLDIRSEVNPDIVGDYRDLKEFADNSFRLVVLDPPHHTKPLPFEKRRPDRFTKCYGLPLNPETWPSDIKKGILEGMRVLMPYGVLIFKWSTINIKVESVIETFPVKPLFGQRMTGHNIDDEKTQTYWFCFMKIPTSFNPLKMESQ